MKTISNLESTGSSLQFIEDWFDSLPPKAQDFQNGTQYAVRSISISEAGKGYTLITEFFMWFVWKNNEEGRFIKAWIMEQETGLPVIQIDKNRKCRAILLCDDELDFIPLQEPAGSRRVKVIDNMENVHPHDSSSTVQAPSSVSPPPPTVPDSHSRRAVRTKGTVGEG